MAKAKLGPYDIAASCISAHLCHLRPWASGGWEPITLGRRASNTSGVSQFTFPRFSQVAIINQPQRATTGWAVCRMPWPGSCPGPWICSWACWPLHHKGCTWLNYTKNCIKAISKAIIQINIYITYCIFLLLWHKVMTEHWGMWRPRWQGQATHHLLTGQGLAGPHPHNTWRQ